MSTTGTAVSNTTTATSIINKTDLVTITPNIFRKGSRLKIRAAGALSNIATTPGNITFAVKLGTVSVWTSGALSFNASARTSLPFQLNIEMRLDSEGDSTTATWLGMGTFGGIHLSGTDTTIQVPTTAPAVGTGYDSTTANVLDLHATFSVANAGNGIRLWDYLVIHTWN
jgi:hypothetical protein